MDFQLNFLIPGIYLCMGEGMIGQMVLCSSFTASYLNRSVWVFSLFFCFMMLVSFGLFLNSDF